MRLWIITGSSLAFLAVLAGAMGAHALKPTMDAEELSLFETANQYHMWHSLALIIVGILGRDKNKNTRVFSYSGVLFLSGILLFSGILYLTAIWGSTPVHFLIPVGGALFLLGWLLLIVAIWREKN